MCSWLPMNGWVSFWAFGQLFWATFLKLLGQNRSDPTARPMHCPFCSQQWIVATLLNEFQTSSFFLHRPWMNPELPKLSFCSDYPLFFAFKLAFGC